MIRLAALFAPVLMLAAACGEDDAEIVVTAQPVFLIPDEPTLREIHFVRYAGGLELSSTHSGFGGWSGIELSDDGARLLAVSDRGAWMTARLDYDADGDLAGISEVAIAPMLGPDGAPLSGAAADAEGLAALGEGRFVVSFERDHRLAVYDIGEDWSGIAGAVPEPLPAPPGVDRLRDNGGLEALARSGETLWAGVEHPIVDGQPHTLWRYDLASPGLDPTAHTLRMTPGFGLTGMTAWPEEGRLIIVERFWSRDAGNRARISLVGADVLVRDGADTNTAIPIAGLDPGMTVDNFESAAMATVDGRERLFLISDDNFNPDQRTLLMSFEFPAIP